MNEFIIAAIAICTGFLTFITLTLKEMSDGLFRIRQILDNHECGQTELHKKEYVETGKICIDDMKEPFYWKNAKEELPKEVYHYPELWCSQQVLTRKKFKTSEGVERYHYEVCRYMFGNGGRWEIINNTVKFYEPDEWVELKIFV